MQDLNALMVNSYRAHPAFHFPQASWDLSPHALTAFNERYEALRHYAARLRQDGLHTLLQDCQQALQQLFESLKSQTTDAEELVFLSELHQECARLLKEEVAWYARPPLPGFLSLASPQTRESAIRMQADRHFFGCLPASALEEMQGLASRELAQFKAHAAAGRLTRDDLSVNAGPTVRGIRAALNRAFKEMGVLDAVSAYTGRHIRVTGVSLELSVPQATWWRNAIEGLDRPPHTLYAHLDETISCPKAIVYLSDVSESNGPTSCYPGAYEAMQLNPLQEMIGRVVGIVGTRPDSPLKSYYAKQYHQSVNSLHFRRHFMRLPECLRFNSHMGWDVMPESSLEKALVGMERKMLGPAGTFIAFDGARLLHRGGLMQDGERLALQVIFSDKTLGERLVGKVKRILS